MRPSVFTWLLIFGLSFAEGGYAWKAKMSLKNKVAMVTFGAVGVVIAAPVLIVAGTAFGTYKLIKEIKNLFNHEETEKVLDRLSEEEAAKVIAQQQFSEALLSITVQIDNELNVQRAFSSCEEQLIALQSFLKEQRDPDISSTICAFRQRFFPDMRDELPVEVLRDWFIDYKKTSLIPDGYLQKAQVFGLSERTARRLFGIIYHSFERAGISFSS